MYERFTDRARKVMQLANQEAQRFNHEYIGTEHILLGIIKEGSGVAANVLKNLHMELGKVRSEVEKIVQTGPAGDHVILGKLPQTPRAKKVVEYAIEEARGLNHNYVGTEHLLLGLLREQDGVAAQVLMNLGLKLEDVREEVLNLLGQKADERASAYDAGGWSLSNDHSRSSKTPTLDEVGHDLIVFVRKHDVNRLVGRSTELAAVCEVLACWSRKHPVLVGEPGVGKWTLVTGLARSIADGRVPETLRGWRVVLVSTGDLWAGGLAGKAISERTGELLSEAQRAKNTILFLPDAIASLGLPDGGSAAERVHAKLLTALWTDQVPCILSATPTEYQRCLRRRPALEGSVQPIFLRPATVTDALAVLSGVRGQHEAHHGVRITDEAITAAAAAAERLPGVLPGKAVVLIDRACARVRTKAAAPSPELEAQLREIDAQIERANSEKEKAVVAQDYPRGADFRDQADALAKEKERLLRERPDRSAQDAVVDASVVAEVARDLAGDGPPAGP